MPVILIPTYEKAEEFKKHNIIAATVEAEYGNKLLKGEIYTLAHHIVEGKCPCLYDNFKSNSCCNIEKDNIVVSHLDLDTIGGVLALLNAKPQVVPMFWELAAFLDLNGPMALRERYINLNDNNEKDKQEKIAIECIYAFLKFHEEKLSTRYTDITNVTNLMSEAKQFLEKLPKNKELINSGLQWVKEIDEKIEKFLVYENNDIRIFISDGVFCNGAYFSKKLNSIIHCIVTLNEKTKAITLSFYKMPQYNAAQIMKEYFGELAGGHPGIAGTPRGQEYTKEDLLKFVNWLVKEKFKRNIIIKF